MSSSSHPEKTTTDDTKQHWGHRPTNRATRWLVDLLFVGFGLFVLVTTYNMWAAVQPIAGGTTTVGTVTAVASEQHCGRGGCTTLWTPTISFRARDGQNYSFDGPSTPNQITNGKSQLVSYLPSNPTIAHDLSGDGGDVVLSTGLGVFTLMIGLCSFVLGYSAVHKRLGLDAAREGSGWVGQRWVHANRATVIAVASLSALVAMFFVWLS